MALFQSKHVWLKQLGDGVAVLVLDREQSVANFLDPAMLDDLDRALDAVALAAGLRLLVLRSGKATNFCHGPSPALFAGWKKDDFVAWAERGQTVCSKLAGLPMPSVCVIAGSCYDAGLELALACDHRIVVNQETTMLGFPELDWGMIPCWGGAQRLPRLIGLDTSLKMLLLGKRLDAREAWLENLADDLTDEEDEEQPPALLADPVKRDWSVFPRHTWRQRWLEANRLGRWFLFRGGARILRTRMPDDLPAPVAMVNALRQAYAQPELRQGLDFERQAMAHVAEHPALGHLLRLLLHREKLRLPAIGGSEKGRIRQIGVIVSGNVGLLLYLQCATHGYDVVFRAESKEALAMGVLQVSQLLELEVKQGTMTQQQLARILGGFRGTYTWTHFEKLHMILDASEGTPADKRQLFQDMEKHISAAALIVPISPLYRVEDLQAGLQHPERVVGLHLVEPWSPTSLAEIVAPPSVAAAHVQRVRGWAVGLGKCCLQAPDRVGGVVMRVWMPALNEAGLLVKEGVPIDRIDHAMRRFGMTYGPLEWIDRLGLDHVAALASVLQSLFAGRIMFESGFSLMVKKQWLGNKSGLGFYGPGLRKRRPHRDAAKLWQMHSQGEVARPRPALSDTDALAWVQDRLVTLMLLEAVRCLDDGIVKDADDLDCAMCLTGWATHRGGPIGYAQQIGAEAVTARCLELSQQHGPRYAPIASLTGFLKR